MRTRNLLCASILAMVMFGAATHAEVIKPVDATASTFFPGRDPDTSIINGNGLTGDGSAGSTHGNAAAEGPYWSTNPGDVAPEITFDLGGLYDVTTMRIWNWNYTGLTDGGVEDVDVYAGATLGSMALVGSYTFAQADGTATYTGEDIALSTSGVRYIRFDITTFYNMAYTWGGLSEVRFEGSQYGGSVITPTTATASSYYSARLPANTWNGSGLTGDGSPGSTHLASGGEGNMWSSNLGDVDPSITYDLGAVYDVNVMRIWNWNYAGFASMGVSNTEVFAGPTLGSMTSRGVFSLAQAPGTDGYLGEDVVVSFTGVRYISFDILSTHAGTTYPPGGAGGDTGLSEVRFRGTALDVGAIITPAAAVANTEWGSPIGDAIHLIDASRIDGANQLVPGGWDTGYVGRDDWGTWENWVYIDLGKAYPLDEIRIWNYTETDTANNLIGRSTKTSSLWVAGAGATLPTPGVPTGQGTAGFTAGMGWTSIWAGDLNIGETTLNPVEPDQVFDASAQPPVRYVGLDIDSRWGGDAFRGKDPTYPTPFTNYAPGLGYIQVTEAITQGTLFVIR